MRERLNVTGYVAGIPQLPLRVLERNFKVKF